MRRGRAEPGCGQTPIGQAAVSLLRCAEMTDETPEQTPASEPPAPLPPSDDPAPAAAPAAAPPAPELPGRAAMMLASASAQEIAPDAPRKPVEPFSVEDPFAGPAATVAAPSRRPRLSLPVILAALIGLVLGALLIFALVRGGFVSAGTGGPLEVSGATVGSMSAPVTIEIWADFQCPFCAAFTHAIEPTVLRELVGSGAARVVFKDYAFLGQESIDAAVAARCATDQGSFWSYHDLLYASQQGENQGGFSSATLLGLARYDRLDLTTFTGCLRDPAKIAAVASETQAGKNLGITSTPTIRVIGPGGTKEFKGVTPYGALADAVRQVRTVGAGGASSGASDGSSAPSASSGAGSGNEPSPTTQ